MPRGRPRRRGNDSHEGASVGVIPGGIESGTCCGASHKDDDIALLQAYAIRDLQDASVEIKLCKTCAVKLALKIFELESL